MQSNDFDIPLFFGADDLPALTLNERLAAAGALSFIGLGLTGAVIGLLGVAEMVRDAVL